MPLWAACCCCAGVEGSGSCCGMETYQLAQIAVVFCCLLGLWVRGGQELVQGYIFTVAFMFLVFTMVVLGP